MSKKNKNFNKNFGNEAPEIYNMDDIGYMADEAIHDRTSRLEFERGKLISMNKDPHLWEVELAYLQREQGLRQTRAAAHADFLKKFMTPAEVDSALAQEPAEPAGNVEGGLN